MNRPPIYSYAVPVVLGLVAAAAPASFPFADRFFLALLASTGVFGLAGLICGAAWPSLRWRWAVWVIAPGAVLVTAGVLSSGEYASFFADDLPFIGAGLLGAAIGASLGARLRTGGPER